MPGVPDDDGPSICPGRKTVEPFSEFVPLKTSPYVADVGRSEEVPAAAVTSLA